MQFINKIDVCKIVRDILLQKPKSHLKLRFSDNSSMIYIILQNGTTIEL